MSATNVVLTGNDPRVFQSESRGFRLAYTAPPYGSVELKCGMVVDAKTESTTKSFEWASLFSMSNYANQGENVAVYGKGFKYANGPTWAGCFESKDLTNSNKGALYGLEVDVWANGPGNSSRFGIGFNFGNATGGVKPNIDFGIDFSPHMGNRNNAELSNGIRVMLDCTDSVIKVGNGAVTPTLLDTSQANVGTFLKINSASPMFSSLKQTTRVGSLKVIIDGGTYYIPVEG